MATCFRVGPICVCYRHMKYRQIGSLVIFKNTPEWQKVVPVRRPKFGIDIVLIYSWIDLELHICFVTYYLSTLEFFTLHFEINNDFHFSGFLIVLMSKTELFVLWSFPISSSTLKRTIMSFKGVNSMFILSYHIVYFQMIVIENL